MMKNTIVLLAIAAMLTSACRGNDEAAPPGTNATPEASETPEPTATASPDGSASTPLTLDQPKIIFMRDISKNHLGAGTLWMSEIDGSDQRQLTASGELSSFAGLPRPPEDGQIRFYYVSWGTGTARTVWALNIGSGERLEIEAFDAERDYEAYASTSPDGTRVAYNDADGIAIRDLATGNRRLLLEGGDIESCDFDRSVCFRYSEITWSPDSKMLAVRKTFYESGITVVIDVSSAALMEVEAGNYSFGAWSPLGASICTWGQYAAPSGLYVSDTPAWAKSAYLHEFEGSDTNPGQRTVGDCDWLDEQRVVVSTGGFSVPRQQNQISILNLEGGALEMVGSFDDASTCCGREIFRIPRTTKFMTQFREFSPDGSGPPAQPEVIDVGTGDRHLVLERGDWVVAVVTP